MSFIDLAIGVQSYLKQSGQTVYGICYDRIIVFHQSSLIKIFI